MNLKHNTDKSSFHLVGPLSLIDTEGTSTLGTLRPLYSRANFVRETLTQALRGQIIAAGTHPSHL